MWVTCQISDPVTHITVTDGPIRAPLATETRLFSHQPQTNWFRRGSPNKNQCRLLPSKLISKHSKCDIAVRPQGKDQTVSETLAQKGWHSFRGLCRSHCVESNLALFYTVGRWSQQMPQSEQPVHEHVTSKPFCVIMTQSKPVCGRTTAHR